VLGAGLLAYPTLKQLSEAPRGSVEVPASASDHSASRQVLCACSGTMSNTGLRAVGGVAKKGAKKAAAGFSGALLVQLV
jgi:hypothetical protein